VWKHDSSVLKLRIEALCHHNSSVLSYSWYSYFFRLIKSRVAGRINRTDVTGHC
jgi:hypothetical protein